MALWAKACTQQLIVGLDRHHREGVGLVLTNHLITPLTQLFNLGSESGTAKASFDFDASSAHTSYVLVIDDKVVETDLVSVVFDLGGEVPKAVILDDHLSDMRLGILCRDDSFVFFAFAQKTHYI